MRVQSFVANNLQVSENGRSGGSGKENGARSRAVGRSVGRGRSRSVGRSEPANCSYSALYSHRTHLLILASCASSPQKSKWPKKSGNDLPLKLLAPSPHKGKIMGV